MKGEFHYAEPSPDPFGGERKAQPWFRVVHKHPAGQVTPVFDFILDAKLAMDMAHARDIDWRAGRGEGANP